MLLGQRLRNTAQATECVVSRRHGAAHARGRACTERGGADMFLPRGQRPWLRCANATLLRKRALIRI
eukprot:11556433-Alexandrium_andersonii.AAC.1